MSEETIFKAEEAAKLKVHSSTPAYILIGGGVLLLFTTLFNIDLMEVLWPGFIIGPGLLLMWPAYQSTSERQSNLSFLAIPGAMILTSGVLLMAMNLTDHFEAWAYSWPLVIASIPAAVMYITRFDNNSALHERAVKFIRVMIMGFIGLAFFFEIIVFGNFNPLMSIGLIALGVYMLARNKRSGKLV